jgi:hypothetical protein
VSEFTIQDAKMAGTKNLNKFPKNMLFARAISNGAKWFAAGIFGGSPVYTPEELGASTDEDGYIDVSTIDGEFSQDEPLTIPERTELTQEELAISEQAAMSGVSPVADIRASLEEYAKMTVIQVADAVVMTGAYNNQDHVHNALLQREDYQRYGGKLSSGVTKDIALTWFDWLVSRKEVDAE